MDVCRSCDAPIRWVRTAKNNKSMPLDALPNHDGNVVIDDGVATVLGPLELEILSPERARYMPHHATCPQRDEWHRARNSSDPLPPLARSTDPQTSHQGAKDVVPRAGSQMARLLVDAYAKAVDLIDEEAGALTGCSWKRCSDLRRLGYIEPTGTTRIAQTGSAQAVCRITGKGLALVRSLNGSH